MKPASTMSIHLRGNGTEGEGGRLGGQVLAYLLSVAHMEWRARKRRGSWREI